MAKMKAHGGNVTAWLNDVDYAEFEVYVAKTGETQSTFMKKAIKGRIAHLKKSEGASNVAANSQAAQMGSP